MGKLFWDALKSRWCGFGAFFDASALDIVFVHFLRRCKIVSVDCRLVNRVLKLQNSIFAKKRRLTFADTWTGSATNGSLQMNLPKRISLDGSPKTDLPRRISSNGSPQMALPKRISLVRSTQTDLPKQLTNNFKRNCSNTLNYLYVLYSSPSHNANWSLILRIGLISTNTSMFA